MLKFKIAFNRQAFVGKPANIDWMQLNQSFINVERDLVEICNAIYKGHPFCPWMKGVRSKENFVCAQHIGIDMDTQDYRSSMDALWHHPLIQQYGAIIYNTPSHHPAAPKSRVVFLLDRPIESEQGYLLAIQTLCNLFDGADPACVDSARFFYGNGKLCETGDIDGIWFGNDPLLPLQHLRGMAKQYLAEQREMSRQQTAQRNGARPQPRTPPGKDPSLDDIAVLLDKIDAWSIDYNWWLTCVAAVKNTFGDAGYDIVQRWSQKPGDDGLTWKKWQSLNGTGSHGPATLATVYKIAQEQGVSA